MPKDITPKKGIKMSTSTASKTKTLESISKTMEIRKVVIDKIQISGNIRPIHREWVEELKKKMVSSGFDSSKPGKGRFEREDGIFHLFDGQHRLTAVKELNQEYKDKKIQSLYGENAMWEPMTHFPAVNETKGTDEVSRMLEMFNSNDTKPLDKLEIANLFSRLIKFGLEEKEIAWRIGKSVTYVSDMLRLNALPQELKEAVKEKIISPTAAIASAKHGTMDKALLRLQEVKKENKDNKATKKKVMKVDEASKKVDKEDKNPKITRSIIERNLNYCLEMQEEFGSDWNTAVDVCRAILAGKVLD